MSLLFNFKITPETISLRWQNQTKYVSVKHMAVTLDQITNTPVGRDAQRISQDCAMMSASPKL